MSSRTEAESLFLLWQQEKPDIAVFITSHCAENSQLRAELEHLYSRYCHTDARNNSGGFVRVGDESRHGAAVLDYAPPVENRAAKVARRLALALLGCLSATRIAIGGFLGGLFGLLCFAPERVQFGCLGFAAACSIGPILAVTAGPVQRVWWHRAIGIFVGLILMMAAMHFDTEYRGFLSSGWEEKLQSDLLFARHHEASGYVWLGILAAPFVGSLILIPYNKPHRRLAAGLSAVLGFVCLSIGIYRNLPIEPTAVIRPSGEMHERGLSFSGDFSLCVTTDRRTMTARLWRVRDGRELQSFSGCDAAAILPDGRRTVFSIISAPKSRPYGDPKKTLSLIDNSTKSQILTFEDTVNADDPRLLVKPRSNHGLAFTVHLESYYDSDHWTRLVVSSDGRRVLGASTVDNERVWAVWDVGSGRLLTVLPRRDASNALLSGDGKHLLSMEDGAYVGGKFVVQRMLPSDQYERSRDIFHEQPGRLEQLRRLETPLSALVLWDVDEKSVVNEVHLDAWGYQPTGFADDGETVMLEHGWDIEIWSLGRRTMTHRYSKRNEGVYTLSPDGRSVARKDDSYDDLIFMSRVDTGAETGRWRTAPYSCNRLVFSPDGRHLANIAINRNRVEVYELSPR